MKLGEPDDSGRRRPEPIPGSTKTLDCDLAIIAIGSGANPLITRTTPGLDVNKWGLRGGRRGGQDQEARSVGRRRHRHRRGHGHQGRRSGPPSRQQQCTNTSPGAGRAKARKPEMSTGAHRLPGGAPRFIM